MKTGFLAFKFLKLFLFFQEKIYMRERENCWGYIRYTWALNLFNLQIMSFI